MNRIKMLTFSDFHENCLENRKVLSGLYISFHILSSFMKKCIIGEKKEDMFLDKRGRNRGEMKDSSVKIYFILLKENIKPDIIPINRNSKIDVLNSFGKIKICSRFIIHKIKVPEMIKNGAIIETGIAEKLLMCVRLGFHKDFIRKESYSNGL